MLNYVLFLIDFPCR